MTRHRSLALARAYLGKQVDLKFDQPVNSSYAPHGITAYPINYGYVPDTKAPDGDELDAYLLNVTTPLDSVSGVYCIAIIHRLHDDDDKLVCIPTLSEISDEDISQQVDFQEHLYEYVIIRK